jgi:hypothetical protein
MDETSEAGRKLVGFMNNGIQHVIETHCFLSQYATPRGANGLEIGQVGVFDRNKRTYVNIPTLTALFKNMKPGEVNIKRV